MTKLSNSILNIISTATLVFVIVLIISIYGKFIELNNKPPKYAEDMCMELAKILCSHTGTSICGLGKRSSNIQCGDGKIIMSFPLHKD